MRNQQNVKVKNGSSWETICPFPVGYVYMSSNSTSPASIYGGTWSPISGGRYMRAAAAWGNGGSNTITVSQMPAHIHGAYTSVSGAHTHDLSVGGGPGSGVGIVPQDNVRWLGGFIQRTGAHQHSVTIQSTGEGAAFYPTYQNVYCWYRTA